MTDTCSFVDVRATKPSIHAEWFRYFEVVMRHPDLNRDEQYLWLWLATHCVNRSHHSCSISYQQISQVVKMSYKAIHVALFRLKLTGLLNGDIPVWYGEPTDLMVKEERVLRPMTLSETSYWLQDVIKRKRQYGVPIFETYDKKPILFNLRNKF